MRTPILVAALGFGLAGCLIGDSGTPATGDDDDGPGTGSQGSGSNQTPKLDVTADKTAISTELLTNNMITVTLRSSGGFTGAVTLTGTAVDTAGTAIPGWTVTFDKPSVTMASNGTSTAVATVKVPSDSAAMSGMLKVEASSSLGTQMLTSMVSVTKTLSINITLAGANCVYPAVTNGVVKVAQGTKIRWVNGDAANPITIHVNGGIMGLVHQPDSTPPGGAYEQTVGAATGTSRDWYCHTKNDPGNMGLTTNDLQAVP